MTSLAFSILYIGLGYLGNKFSVPENVLTDPSINKGAYVLAQASYQLFGSFGRYFLSVMVILTCFTTTVGLIVAVSEFFAKHFTKLSYKVYLSLFTLIGFLIANLGLNAVIAFSLPVLSLLYPIVIVLVVIILLNKLIPLSKRGMSLTIVIVTIISFLEVLAGLMPKTALATFADYLPLHAMSVGWLLPTMFGLVIAMLLPDKIRGEVFDLKQFEKEA